MVVYSDDFGQRIYVAMDFSTTNFTISSNILYPMMKDIVYKFPYCPDWVR